MKDSQALRPGNFSISEFVREKKTETGDIGEEEKIFAQGRKTVFWKHLKEHFDNEIGNLNQIQEVAIAQGAPREQIGENAVVISITNGVLKRIVDRVEDAREEKSGK